jgi:hypothetical protein
MKSSAFIVRSNSPGFLDLVSNSCCCQGSQADSLTGVSTERNGSPTRQELLTATSVLPKLCFSYVLGLHGSASKVPHLGRGAVARSDTALLKPVPTNPACFGSMTLPHFLDLATFFGLPMLPASSLQTDRAEVHAINIL